MEEQVQKLAVGLLLESKTNPRQSYDKQQMKDLESSVAEQGIVTPILVRPDPTHGADTDASKMKYEIISGHRRVRVAKLLKLEAVPAIVRELTDEETLEVQVIENEQRADVHPYEQAVGYDRLIKAGLSRAEVATRIGKPISHVHQRLQYLKLIEPAKKMFLGNHKLMWASHADQIARLTPEQQAEVLKWFKDDETMSPHSLADEINEHFFLRLKDAPFDIESKSLVEAAGSCTECPKRTGANKLLFADVEHDDTCTDPKCYEGKTRAFIKIQVGMHPKAVLLTVGRHYSYGSDKGKEKGLTDWVKAGNERCDDTKQGVVVEIIDRYPDEKQKASLGQAIYVCTNPKCKTHHPKTQSDYNSQTGGSRKAEKARKLELKRRSLVFKELSVKKLTIAPEERRDILDWMVELLGNDNARAVCQAMAWEPTKHVKGSFDYRDSWRETIAKNLKKLTAQEVEHWTFLIFAAANDLWFFNNSGIPKAKFLEAKAKAAGVSLAAIAKVAKEKPKKAIKPKKGKAA